MNWLRTQKNLQFLYLSHSSIIDKIPKWFENILSHILHVDLSYNQIGGKVPQFPDYNSNQMHDWYLMMKSNKFEGLFNTFPSKTLIMDLSDYLLSGSVPQIDGTMNPRLQVVNLLKNCFTGSIPVNLCNVPSIQILDLSQNNFSGNLPSCLRNLINLEVLDLANNTVTGVLPTSLGSISVAIAQQQN